MCGIAGLLHFDGRPVDPALLDRMTDVLAHRGPDGRGTHIDGPLGLGHRRLAIIDLTPDGAQPMCNEDGGVWVVLNGEIYNFQALRAELEGKGHRFRSRSDTEVLVHLWEEEGPRLVERLRGMFAFALWDARARRLLLARDRFGKKPLYYRLDAASLRFGSEVKAILEDPAVPREPDLPALWDYLTYGYVPAPGTAFAGVRKLEPGHVLVVEADGRSRLSRYWALPMSPKRRLATRAEEDRAIEELLGELDEATRLRMIADVPLGAFLSGGLDSSSVVASMCAVTPPGGPRVRTFSIGFDEPAWDERAYADLVARKLGTAHETLVLRPDGVVDLDRIAWHYGEPFADSSCLPTFAVSKLARQRVTVALSGDGGDELFVGYRRYVGTHLDERLRGAPGFVRRAAYDRYLIHLLHQVPWLRTIGGELAHGRWLGDLPLADRYLTRIELLGRALKAELAGPALRSLVGTRDSADLVRRLIAASPGEAPAERCAHADVTTYLPDDILVKVDVASMAYGLETRCPLLDHVLAERVAVLPYRLKMRRLDTKLALKRAAGHRLPPEILTRPKAGFGVPIEAWFRGGVRGLLEERLLDAPRVVARGLIDEAGLRRLIDEHVGGARNHVNALFPLLMLETWLRQWIDPPAGAAIERRPAVTAAAGAPVAGAAA